MRTKLLIAALLTSPLMTLAGFGQALAGPPLPPLPPPPPPLLAPPPPPGVSVNVNGYLPPPPGVHVHVDSGRPYYVEHGHRVYMKKKIKHDHGRKRGHYKHKH